MQCVQGNSMFCNVIKRKLFKKGNFLDVLTIYMTRSASFTVGALKKKAFSPPVVHLGKKRKKKKKISQGMLLNRGSTSPIQQGGAAEGGINIWAVQTAV